MGSKGLIVCLSDNYKEADGSKLAELPIDKNFFTGVYEITPDNLATNKRQIYRQSELFEYSAIDFGKLSTFMRKDGIVPGINGCVHYDQCWRNENTDKISYCRLHNNQCFVSLSLSRHYHIAADRCHYTTEENEANKKPRF